MGDVGEWSAVNDNRRAFQRLHQVRLHRFLQQCAHGLHRIQAVRRDRLPFPIVTDQHPSQSRLQIGQIAA
ncbi:hypothetical protein D3C76_1636450 [compost metagenome]